MEDFYMRKLLQNVMQNKTTGESGIEKEEAQ